jgi:hypothetical protein
MSDVQFFHLARFARGHRDAEGFDFCGGKSNENIERHFFCSLGEAHKNHALSAISATLRETSFYVSTKADSSASSITWQIKYKKP